MRSTRLLRTAAGLVGVLVLLAACAGPPTADGPPMPGMTPVPVAVTNSGVTLTAEQIAAAVLAPADVPADWQPETGTPQDLPTTSLGFYSPDATAVDPAPCVDLGTAGGPKAPQTAFLRVGFFTTGYGYVAEDVTTWPEPDAGARMVAAARAWVAACPQFTVTSADGSVSTFTLTLLESPDVGDQAISVRISSESSTPGSTEKVAFTADETIVVVGNVVIALVAGGEETIDPALFAQLTTTAAAKVLAAAA